MVMAEINGSLLLSLMSSPCWLPGHRDPNMRNSTHSKDRQCFRDNYGIICSYIMLLWQLFVMATVHS